MDSIKEWITYTIYPRSYLGQLSNSKHNLTFNILQRVWILQSLNTTWFNIGIISIIQLFLIFHVDNMFKLKKKDLAAMAKKIKTVSQASPAKDLKLKAVVEVAPSYVEDMCSGPVF